MHVIEAKTGREAMVQVARALEEHGKPVSPRGLKTLELSPASVTIEAPWDVLCDGIGRANYTPAIGAAEALQLIGGYSYPDLLCAVAPKFANFLNEHGTFDGAYGPRLRRQLHTVVDRLRADNDTRQAVAAVWNEFDVHRAKSRDYPCTCVLHFLIREGALDLHVTMRSNDAWLGFPYDIFQFAQLQCTVAKAVSVAIGRYHHVANSLHVYERNYDQLFSLRPRWDAVTQGGIFGVGAFNHTDSWGVAQLRANAILKGHRLYDPTESELWYIETLAPYV